MIQYAMKIGVRMGILWIILYGCLVLSPRLPLLSLLYLIILFLVPIYLYRAIKGYNRTFAQSTLRFSQLWSLGILIFFFSAMIVALPQYIHLQYIEPEFISTQYNMAIELLRSYNLEQSINLSKDLRMPTALDIVTQQMSLSLYIGVILSLIISPFARIKSNHQ